MLPSLQLASATLHQLRSVGLAVLFSCCVILASSLTGLFFGRFTLRFRDIFIALRFFISGFFPAGLSIAGFLACARFRFQTLELLLVLSRDSESERRIPILIDLSIRLDSTRTRLNASVKIEERRIVVEVQLVLSQVLLIQEWVTRDQLTAPLLTVHQLTTHLLRCRIEPKFRVDLAELVQHFAALLFNARIVAGLALQHFGRILY